MFCSCFFVLLQAYTFFFRQLFGTAGDHEILKFGFSFIFCSFSVVVLSHAFFLILPESEYHENYQRVYEFLGSLFKEDFNPESVADMSDDDWGIVEFLLGDMQAAVTSKGCTKQLAFLHEAVGKITSKVSCFW